MTDAVSVGELVDQGLAQLQTGPFGTQLKASEYVPVGIPVINVRNVGFGGIRDDKLEYVDIVTAERLRQHRLQAHDIVFGRKGAVERHAFLRADHDGWLQGSDCIRLRIHGGPLMPRFVSYFLATGAHQQWMTNQCSHGATMASLNQDILRRIEIPAPPWDTQRRVVSVLAAYDELIENNLRRIEILEEMAQVVYREWFVNFLFPGHEDVTLADSLLGPIPDGWEVATVVDAIDLKPRERVGRGQQVRFVPMRSLIEGSMVIDGWETREQPSGSKFRNGDTLLARITPCLENGKTGFVQFLDGNEIACGSTEFIVMRSRTVTPTFVYLLARTDEFRGNAIKSMVGASGRQRVQEKAVEGFRFAHPPQPLLECFEALVGPMFKLVLRLVDQNTNLRSTRDLLLPKLVSGEIDVSELDIETEWLAS